MEALNAKDFMDKLQHGTLRPACILKGVVKKSAEDNEILFKSKKLQSGWVKIPASMINSVIVLKNIRREEEELAVVKLLLRAPSTSEGTVLFGLLSAAMQQKTSCKSFDKEWSGSEPGPCVNNGFCSVQGHCHRCGCSCNNGCGCSHNAHYGHQCQCHCH